MSKPNSLGDKLNVQYVKPAAFIMIWGVGLFIGGGVMSGFLSYRGLVEEVSSPFGRSDAGPYFGAAALFGLASLVGLVFLLVALRRTVSRIDQRYDVWFSRGQAEPPIDPHGDGSGEPVPVQVQRPQNPQDSQYPQPGQQAYPQQYRLGPPAPQQPPRAGANAKR